VVSVIVAVCKVIIRSACLLLSQPIISAAARVHNTVRRTKIYSYRVAATGFSGCTASESMREYFCWTVIGDAESDDSVVPIWIISSPKQRLFSG